MNAAVYLRKSRSDDPNEEISETLRRHRETLTQFAKNNRIVIDEVYEEVVSGDSLYARTEMLRLLSDIETKHYDCVLCMDIDRLGRGSMAEQGIILEALKGNNIRIVTPRKIYDLNNEIDEEYTEFETFMARRELKMIKRRLGRGLEKTIEEGGYISNAPYGYKKTIIDKKPSLEIIEEEAAFVRMIFDMYVNQNVGCQIIADTISAMGAKPHRSPAFSRTTIGAIIQNPVYIGKFARNTQKKYRGKDGKIHSKKTPKSEWKLHDGVHQPIISEELFSQANAIFNERYHLPSNKGTVCNPLAGFLKCGICGRAMVRMPSSKDRKNGFYQLICTTKGCVCSSRLDRVEAHILHLIEEHLNAIKALKHSEKSAKAISVDYDAAIRSVQKELDTASSQLEKLQDLLEQGVYDTETYTDRSVVLKKRIHNLRSQKESLEAEKLKENTKSLDETIALYEDVLRRYSVSTPEVKNALLRSVIHSGVYYKEKGREPSQFIVELTYKD